MHDVASLAEEIVRGKGYVLLPGLFMPEETSEARSQILKLASEQPVGFSRTSRSCSHDRLRQMSASETLLLAVCPCASSPSDSGSSCLVEVAINYFNSGCLALANDSLV
jgi:hypothetical protein